MKIWKIAGIVSVFILIAAAVGLAIYREEDDVMDTGVLEQNEVLEDAKGGKSPPADNQEELYERLQGFAQVLYEYDTDERKFYEGAETYMTEDAFPMLRPQDSAEQEDGKAIRMQSWLISADAYVHYHNEESAIVIMESQFTLSQTVNGAITQYLKLSVEKIDGQWMITECHVIDTLEE